MKGNEWKIIKEKGRTKETKGGSGNKKEQKKWSKDGKMGWRNEDKKMKWKRIKMKGRKGNDENGMKNETKSY